MNYYGFRFFTAYESIMRRLEDKADARRQGTYGEDYAMEWAEAVREELEEARQERKTALVRSEQKVAGYQKFARSAYAFAKEKIYDILISDAAGEYALVIFYVDSVFLTDKDRKGVGMFIELLAQADEVYIDPDEDCLCIKLVYDLCVKCPLPE